MEYIGYIIASVMGILLGQAAKHLNFKLPPVVSEEITYKEFFKSFKEGFKIDFVWSSIFLVLFNAVVYFLGTGYLSWLYMIVIFALAIVFSVDYRFQLIPDETHVVIAICGIINMCFNLSQWYMYLLGAIVGGGIFYLLGILALVIYKKEGMGFGDVKLMAALGLLFGFKNILVIAVLSFAIGAVVSLILMITRVKKMDSYIPFGPFIVVAAILVMFFNADVFIQAYFAVCTPLSTVITDVMFKLMK